MKILILLFLSLSSFAYAHTELGLSYQYRKTNFDEDNFSESQSTTGSVSIYFWDRVGLELSYTDGRYDRNESVTINNTTQTIKTSQKVLIYGGDLIFLLMDPRSSIQPYLKAGMAHTKKQLSVNNGTDVTTSDPVTGWAPSYGAGIKFMLTQQFSLKVSYDIWSTPQDSQTKTDDTALRVGLSWTL